MKLTTKEDCTENSSNMFEMKFEESLIFAQFFNVMDDSCYGASGTHVFYTQARKQFMTIQLHLPSLNFKVHLVQLELGYQSYIKLFIKYMLAISN